MVHPRVSSDMYDPRRGDEAIRTQRLDLANGPFEPARTNYFAVYLIQTGAGMFWADASSYSFGPSSLLFFVPYQHIRFAVDAPLHGEVVQFHANFLCVETFHAEVGCSGVLFNDPYGPPVVALDERAKAEMIDLFERIHAEEARRELAYREAMLAHLKVLLILATRLKSSTAAGGPGAHSPHPVLAELRELIERNYQASHSPADYAKRLHVTAKTLGRLVREHLGTTLTELIRNRLLIHAKWELLHTLKPIKEIAGELGFADELYFSRFFKKATGQSPTFFRQFETEIRGRSNLSVFSGHAPIHPSTASSDT